MKGEQVGNYTIWKDVYIDQGKRGNAGLLRVRDRDVGEGVSGNV